MIVDIIKWCNENQGFITSIGTLITLIVLIPAFILWLVKTGKNMTHNTKKWCGKIRMSFINFCKSKTKKHFRLLMDGLFTTEIGNSLTGSFVDNTGTFHLMPSEKIILLGGIDGNYTITMARNIAPHFDQTPPKRLQTGSILKLFNAKLFNTVEWVKLKSDPVQVADVWQFDTEPYTPTEREENAITSQ